MPTRAFSLVFVALLSLGAARSSCSQTPPFAWPTGPSGEAARAFFAMLADGSDDSIRAFETAHRATAALAAVPMDERVRRAQDLRRRFADLRPERVVRSTDTQLVIAAHAGDGRAVDFEFNLAPGEPGRLASIGIALLGPRESVASLALTPSARAALVEGVARSVAERYVFPEDGRKMAEKIRGEQSAGRYDVVADEAAMAERLTEDLRAVRNDKHLAVRLQPKPGGDSQRPPHGGLGEDPERDNFAFRRVEWLPGNVGYLKLDQLFDDPEALATADAAMTFLRFADAIVIDLRDNGGGSPRMIRHLTSYFFPERTHLNDMLDRDGRVIEEFWTGEVPGKKFARDLPLFVLTSSHSFSGAEEFAYNLKALKRATIVGETTGGGAHPVAFVPVGERFVVGVPFLRAQNPITLTNWEGVGVEPDIKVTAAQALDAAHQKAEEAIGRRAPTPP